MFLAPAVPVLIDIGSRALLEGFGLHGRLGGFCLQSRRALLLDDVDACADLLARRIALDPRLPERNILQRPEAVPAFLAFEPVPIGPIL